MMAPKTITISEDAYRRLARLKRKQESFSELIQRLTGRHDLMRFVGSISQEFADELEAAVAKTRREVRDAERRRSV